MKTVEWRSTRPEFEGTVTLKVLTFRERMNEMKSLGVAFDDIEKLDLEKKLQFFDKVINAVDKVDLVHKETGTKISSVEDLETYKESMAILIDLFKVYIEGPSLGKSSGTP